MELVPYKTTALSVALRQGGRAEGVLSISCSIQRESFLSPLKAVPNKS